MPLEGLGEEVGEEGFQDGRAAADETGVDFDDAVTDQRRFVRQGEKRPHLNRKVLASSHAVS